MKKKIFLAITINNGKAEAYQISEKYYNDFNWRLKRKEDAEKGEFQIYFTETEITINA